MAYKCGWCRLWIPREGHAATCPRNTKLSASTFARGTTAPRFAGVEAEPFARFPRATAPTVSGALPPRRVASLLGRRGEGLVLNATKAEPGSPAFAHQPL